MKQKIENIFSKTDCLSQEQIIRYADNKSDDNELRSVELHLADCPACNDVLEGYQNLSDKNTLNARIKRINEKIDHRVKKHKIIAPSEKRIKPQNKTLRMRIRRTISVAASLLLLAAVGFLINHYVQNGAADNASALSQTEEKAADEKSIVNDYIAPETETESSEPENPHTEKELMKEDAKDAKTEIVNEISADEGTIPNEDLEDAEENNVAVELDESVKNDRNSDLPEADSDNEEINTAEETALSSSAPEENIKTDNDTKKSETVSEIEEEAMFGSTVRSGSNHSIESAETSEKREKRRILGGKNRPNTKTSAPTVGSAADAMNTTDALQTGNELFEQKEYAKALAEFERALTGTDKKQKSEAEWMKARCLLELNQTKKARKLLRKISESGNRYSSRAKERLEKNESGN